MDMEPYLEVQYDCKKHTREGGREEKRLINLQIDSVWSNRGGLDLEKAVQAALKEENERIIKQGEKSEETISRENRSFEMAVNITSAPYQGNRTYANKNNIMSEERKTEKLPQLQRQKSSHRLKRISGQDYIIVIIVSTVVVIITIISTAALLMKVFSLYRDIFGVIEDESLYFVVVLY